MTRKEFLRLTGLGLAAFVTGCRPSPSASRRKHWAWMGANVGSEEAARRTFARLRASGIDALLLHENRAEGPAFYERLIPLAQAEGLELHAWIPTMMRAELLEDHPDWYAVNREGVSTAQQPPYVDYYRFLSPCVPGVRTYLANYYDRMAQIEGLAGLHLDYIRFPDVILPITLQPKYGLVQDREYPPFDYGYHPECRSQFKAQTGLDPLQLEDPSTHAAWRQFRYDQITTVVRQIAARVHARGKPLTAAVFPTPEIARTLVRQDWPRWPLDAVMPMIYHNFYDKPVAWIETATREGVKALDGRIPLYSGLFIPALTPAELDQAIDYALAGGAAGVSLFNVESLTDAHWKVLKARLRT
ncbi:hypothetical protein [Rhodothermus profundi]|uniref:Glycosyl hydrolase-like 10 n=1 Tax=Rhodothermus profundi TaxID=633813 RepID=A0A1M6R8L4_9BACT|nr:hypothetical protein [Rhodothermus profundi]SHK28637.1 hypothetical protein SAMN04488087_0742 [Rhodothermus profundi]